MIFDAVIVGGGPSGATAAFLLARAGWSVAIVEQTEFPRRKVCGEFISSGSEPLLRALGVAAAFDAAAGPAIRRVAVFAGDEAPTAPMPRAYGPAGPWGRALGRESLDRLLLEAAVRAGATLWQPWRAVSLRRDRGGVTCEMTAKHARMALSARIGIGAHGSWGREILSGGDGGAHQPADLLAFKAHFGDCALPDDLMPLLVFPGGYGGMVHTDCGRVTFSCCIRRDQLARCRRRWPSARAGKAVLAHVQTSCGGVRHALRHARLEGAWLSAGPINPGIRKSQRNGIFLVGNAAAEAHPIIAEGITMAMQSSALLARDLVARQDDLGRDDLPAMIEAGQKAQRRSCFAPRVHTAALLALGAMRPAVVAHLLPIARRFPGLLTVGAQLSGKGRGFTDQLWR